MNFWDKYNNNLLTIEDQKEALKKSEWSYWFAELNISGSDFKALQEKACEEPYCAYWFALGVPDADVKYCQEHACQDPDWAYRFAKNVPNADVKFCQELACKDPEVAYLFARDIPKSDKEYCFKHAFPENTHGPNYWKSEYNKYIMKKACE